jgi:hypothetical protein
VVDHVSVHALPPFAATSAAAEDDGGGDDYTVSEDAHAAAASLARRLGASLAAAPLPVYFYAAAHAAAKPLADVRRALGYFGNGGGVPSSAASAASSASAPAPLPPPPDAGPRVAAPASGVACVGALPWVVNYNLLLVPIQLGDARAQPGLHRSTNEGSNSDSDAFAAAAKRVAAATSHRRGGPPGVQALALRHARGWEVACNLLAPFAAGGVGGPAAVRAFVAPLAAAEGLTIDDAYCTNVAPRTLAARARAADAAAQ